MQVPLKDVPCGETLDLWFDMKAPKGKQEKNPLLGGIRVSGRLACSLPACMPSFCGLRLAKGRLTTACDDFLLPPSIISVFRVCTSPYKCWPLMSGRNTPGSRITIKDSLRRQRYVLPGLMYNPCTCSSDTCKSYLPSGQSTSP